jgi:hypothetical protein
MPSKNDATIRQIRRIAGDGGHVTYDVEVQIHDGAVQHFTFNGNIFVGPVTLTIRGHDDQWSGEVIDEPRRFGEFASADWVSRYLAERYSAGAYVSD